MLTPTEIHTRRFPAHFTISPARPLFAGDDDYSPWRAAHIVKYVTNVLKVDAFCIDGGYICVSEPVEVDGSKIARYIDSFAITAELDTNRD